MEMRESVAIQSTDLCPNLNGHNGDSDDPTQVFPLKNPPIHLSAPRFRGFDVRASVNEPSD